MSSQLKQRLFLGSLGTLLLAIAIYFSYSPFFKLLFIVLNIIIIGLALLEYYYLVQHKGLHPLVILGLSCSTAYIVAIYLSLQYPFLSYLPLLILLATLALFFLAFFKGRPDPLTHLATTLFGFAYLVIPLSCVMKINYFFPIHSQQDGRLWLAYVLAITKVTDIGAYFFGKLMGKTKLAPHISPKKTVEGFLGGLFTALTISQVFYFSNYYLAPHSFFQMTRWESIWLGLLLSLLSQFGDLAESVLKRDAGVKDSSNLPGLGGILDVVDSLVFTVPFMYLILEMKFHGSP